MGLEYISDFTELISSLGAIPMVLTAEEHDFITAGVSHLPHIIASALVNLVKTLDNDAEYMKTIAAGGFRDITRIASSSPVMWEQICMTNTVNISRLLQDYIDALGVVQKELQEHDSASLYTFLTVHAHTAIPLLTPEAARSKRITLSVWISRMKQVLSPPSSTLLALNNISIKNIGIVHNREAQEGVLRIEFYEEDSITKAIQLLNRRGYVTHI